MVSPFNHSAAIDIIHMKWNHIDKGYLHIALLNTTDDPDDEFEVSYGSGYVLIKIANELLKVLDHCNHAVSNSFINYRTAKPKARSTAETEKERWIQIAKHYIIPTVFYIRK